LQTGGFRKKKEKGKDHSQGTWGGKSRGEKELGKAILLKEG